MPSVYIFGEADPGDILDIFEEVSRAAGHDVVRCMGIRALRNRVRNGGAGTVLYCLGPGPEKADDDIMYMRQNGSRILVLAHTDKYTPHRAVRAMRSGAHVFRNYEKFPRRTAEIQLLTEVADPPYPEIGSDDWSIVKNSKVFVMTPFAAPYRSEFELVCHSALDPLGLKTVMGDSVITLNEHLMNELKSQTRAASLTIADLSEPLNVNVAIEIGLAHALNVPCLILRKGGATVPADLRGLKLFPYDDDVEAAIGIFKGLEKKVREDHANG